MPADGDGQIGSRFEEQLKIESGEPVGGPADVVKKRPWNSTAPEAKAGFLDFADAMARGRRRKTAQSLQQAKGMAPELTIGCVWITFDGHFTKELAEREVSAWRRFHALRHLLCDKPCGSEISTASAHIMCGVIHVLVC